jgi:ubiquinone/menaquinone biosynthesis C-methylase UbiE
MHTITRNEARTIYNRLGRQLDRAARFESHAKDSGMRLLQPRVGEHILHIGLGTGREHAQLQQHVGATGMVIGVDLSRTMLNLSRERVATPYYEADIAHLPFRRASFDALFSAYVLDLLPTAELPTILQGFRMLLKPTGRLVLIGLTEGISLASKLFVGGWKLAYRLNPQRMGGCRPLQLAPLLANAGFAVERHTIVQRGFPSEILVGTML